MRVELRGVTKRFGAVRALAGVDVAFATGEVSVVTGPNGSGKSTLLSILGTLTRPTSGTVDLSSVGASTTEVRRRLGWVGHDTLCYGDLTGRENLALSSRFHGLSAEEAFLEADRRFQLSAFADRAVRTYSRGQRQRIALARALVHRPALLLLDEPTAGLDRDATAQLVSVVRAEAQRGAVVVLITHDEALAGIGHRSWEMQRGRLLPAKA